MNIMPDVFKIQDLPGDWPLPGLCPGPNILVPQLTNKSISTAVL